MPCWAADPCCSCSGRGQPAAAGGERRWRAAAAAAGARERPLTAVQLAATAVYCGCRRAAEVAAGGGGGCAAGWVSGGQLRPPRVHSERSQRRKKNCCEQRAWRSAFTYISPLKQQWRRLAACPSALQHMYSCRRPGVLLLLVAAASTPPVGPTAGVGRRVLLQPRGSIGRTLGGPLYDCKAYVAAGRRWWAAGAAPWTRVPAPRLQPVVPLLGLHACSCCQCCAGMESIFEMLSELRANVETKNGLQLQLQQLRGQPLASTNPQVQLVEGRLHNLLPKIPAGWDAAIDCGARYAGTSSHAFAMPVSMSWSLAWWRLLARRTAPQVRTSR